MSRVDILWNLYAENCVQGRHHEAQRSTVTNWILVISGGLLGFLAQSTTNSGPIHVWMVGIFMLLMGMFGAFFTSKQSERFDLHMARARNYRFELQNKLPTQDAVDILGLKKKADQENRKDHPFMSELKLRWFFIGIHCGVAAIGLYVSIVFGIFHV